MNDFFKAVRGFLLEHLPNHKCSSEHTIRSYRQALNLFISYMTDKRGIALSQIDFKIIDKNLILGFLDWLESERCCSASTRNQRLMALRTFFNYTGFIDCANIALGLEAGKVPIKKQQPKIVQFLSENALETLFMQPNPKNKTAYRNRFFMILMYDTAARCGEMLRLKVSSLRLDIPYPVAYLHGKGNKVRTVPLLSKTVAHCKDYLERFHEGALPTSEDVLFYTKSHGEKHKMSEDTVALFLNKYGAETEKVCAQMPSNLHPHMLRHTRAMHLYREGMPLPLLSEFLGHADPNSTKIYAYADVEMKRAAIQKADLLQSRTPSVEPIWLNNDDMIMKLAGLV